ncbi:polysaccharide biosynthesis tyrosine autokinase [Curtobacterium sp. MCBD17_028]|uniref:polysaccharide biosynthesis tyrosine autokinase n=1 Tax=Curtobacterium sp. MCBD17_028 TaxID=2175670 RepID=UPI000DA92E46|nr:polysaccharide biosynthesis tyrosine autokinase [Curtobacterium sp. MCBD17_028]PZE27249.1 lipopolysaccharide biosynthesis protein [Curtobacterium sp. MCBD17_028]
MAPDARPDERTSRTLADYVRMFRTYWFGAVLIVLACVAAAGAWTLTQPRVYTSEASGFVRVAGNGDANLDYAADQLSKSQAETYVELGGSLAVAKRVVRATGTSASPQELLGRVQTRLPEGTAIIDVTASGATPRESADLADAWIAGMGRQIAAIQSSGEALASATTKLVPLASATVPTSPTSPDVRAAVTLGVLVGLLLASVYVLVRQALDRRIRSAAAIEAAFGVPVLGTIPLNPALTDHRQLVDALPNRTPEERRVNFATSEALRELRTNLSYVHVDERPKVLVVTSPLPGDGKSTIAANLARSLAVTSTGRVVLIDCDLRRPVLSAVFGVARGAGLTDVLSGRADLADVMQQTDDVGNLWIVGSGRVPPNPSELLGSRMFRDILASLGEHATVVLDAPPILAVTDAVVLAAGADGLVVTVSAQGTTIDQLGRALQLVARGGGTVLGAVLNRVPTRGQDARDYGYYGGAYYAGDDDGSESAPGTDGGAEHGTDGDAEARAARGVRPSGGSRLTPSLPDRDASVPRSPVVSPYDPSLELPSRRSRRRAAAVGGTDDTRP